MTCLLVALSRGGSFDSNMASQQSGAPGKYIIYSKVYHDFNLSPRSS